MSCPCRAFASHTTSSGLTAADRIQNPDGTQPWRIWLEAIGSWPPLSR